jgi:ABC-type nickel/cobalt efflux system permease component RcnA
MHIESLTILALGFTLGLKHALDADHLVAVATIVSERKKILSSSLVGALWGIGHTASLLLVGLIMVVFEVQVPQRVGLILEFGVAAMLIFLGVTVLWRVAKGEVLHLHMHEHHGRKHVHPHIHPTRVPHEHAAEPSHHENRSEGFVARVFDRTAVNARPLLVGVVHGLAGSAALMLIVLSTITSQTLALLYIIVFGVGSIGGMMVMSALIGIPFVLAATKSFFLQRAVRVAAGLASVAFGLFLWWEIGAAGNFF